ncbi:ATP-binding protein [Vibrio vulnificus]|uniref:ATP-binding protein n=1 Tax=Vibrio vulnificus TaxID=672 RepID=UPI0009BB2592|nr:transporter substrate-binding domain-containing protein [Vibrio vulnificus]
MKKYIVQLWEMSMVIRKQHRLLIPKFLLSIFIGLILIGKATLAIAEEIKVGMLDDDDIYSSLQTKVYLSDFESVLNLTNFTAGYYYFGSIDTLLYAVDTGTIDLAIGFSRNRNRESIFDFSMHTTESKVVAWHANYIDINQNSLKSYRWACIKSSVFCSQLETNGIRNILEVENYTEMFLSVVNKRADILLSSYVSIAQFIESSSVEGKVVLPKWVEDEYVSIMVSKKNPRLLSEINQAIIQSANVDNNTHDSQERFDELHRLDNAIMSLEDKFSSDKVFTYYISDEAYPFSFLNSDGENVGYIPDLFDLIESRTGISFTLVSNRNDASSRFDIYPLSIASDKKYNGYNETIPYMNLKYKALVSQRDENIYNENIYFAGVLFANGLYNKDMKNQHFGDMSIVYTDIDDLLKSLKYGAISKAYIREDVLSEYVALNKLDGYTILRDSDIQFSTGMYVSDPDLHQLLNSFFVTLKESDIEKIKKKYFSYNVGYGYQESHVVLASSILIGIIVLLIAVYFIVTKNLTNKVITKEKDIFNIEQSRAFLQSIIETIPAKIWIHNSKHELILTNCVEKIDNNCVGCDMSVASTSQLFVEDWHEIDRVLETGEKLSSYVQAGCSFGTQKHYNYSRIPVKINRIERCVLTIANDITEERANQQLLIEANTKAEKAVQARQMFLATMSHELRTPIAGMMGLLEMVTSKTEDKESLFLLDQISASAKNLNFLVNDILDFSKLESNQVVICNEETSILTALCESLRGHYVAARNKGLNFELDWPANDIKTINIDFLRLNQIINNLLTNAIKFTHKGTVRVQVSLESERIQIIVADTGVGMTQEQKENVFLPFVQADNSITRKYGGTGLGLSIVHDLVSLMGGTIFINSTLGLGTEITVSMPTMVVERFQVIFPQLNVMESGLNTKVKEWISMWCPSQSKQSTATNVMVHSNDVSFYDDNLIQISIRENIHDYIETTGNITTILDKPFFPDLLLTALHQISSEENASSKQTRRKQLSGNVLVAEDNAINAILFSKQLSELGINADVVPNGLIAFNKLTEESHGYDLLITDYHMPEMDGMQLVANLREIECHIPVIGCTAEDFRHIDQEFSSSGFDHVLFKPYTLKQLIKILSKHLPVAEYLNKVEQAIHFQAGDYWLNQFSAEDARDMCTIFLESIADDVAELKQAVSHEDTLRIRNISHRIKGGMGTIGLMRLYELARTVEEKASLRSHDTLELCADLTKQLDLELSSVSQWQCNNVAEAEIGCV